MVEKCVTDMTAGYVGQTAEKTRVVLKEGLGRVLFIDEAYQLNPRVGGRFGFVFLDPHFLFLLHFFRLAVTMFSSFCSLAAS